MNSSSSSNVTVAVSALIVLSAVMFIVYIWAYVRIIRRAGYSGWWILITVVPVVNVVMFLVFAFKEWPIQRELAMLRMQAGGHGGYSQPGYGYGEPYGGGGSTSGW